MTKFNDIKQEHPDTDSTKDTLINAAPKEKIRFTPNSNYFTIMCYGLLFVLCSILIYKLIGNFSLTAVLIGYIIKLISPFIVGAFIAFLLFPLINGIYNKLFMELLHMKRKRMAKLLSILIAYLIAIGLLTLLLCVIAPQVYRSITEISEQLLPWYRQASVYLEEFEVNHPELSEYINLDLVNEKLASIYPTIMNYITSVLTNLLPLILNTSMAIVKGFVSFIISVMVSVYMVSDYKSFFYQGKRVIYAALPAKTADIIRTVVKESGRILSSFVFGKALDSLIIGIICFIAMTILGMPYSVLVSVIVGITNMIPYFGPYFGGAIGFLFILISNPIKALLFILLILVIQQFDGLYLGPKILGESTGLKPVWVIFSITVGGSLFGVLGMFLGVPCVAVLSYILNLIIEHFLKKRNVKIEPYDS